MNPHSGTNDNNNNIRKKTKAIAAIPMAGIIVVTVALVSGLVSFIGNSYHPAIAQTGNATTSTTGGGGGDGGQFPCAPAQTGGGGGQNTSTTATTMGGVATTNMNTTSTTAVGDPLGEVAIHIQEACLAAHNNDIPGVLLHLNLALDTLNAFRSLTLAPGQPEGGEVLPP
jgi:hypothetical protein